MRFASRENDYWELRSAEDSDHESPNTFWIPTLAERTNLEIGGAAKLIFDIEGMDEDVAITVQGERMWVIVTEIGEGYYIGVLDCHPSLLEEAEDVYLRFGAEVPFRPEHIVDIANPPKEYVELILNQPVSRKWHGR